MESNVRYYSRVFPGVFHRAEESYLYDEGGRRYLDFYCGSGSLNYGHNPPHIREALIDYLRDGGIVNAMDLDTRARRRFLDRFDEVVLGPRHLEYTVLCAGPAGTTGVEAALKLARNVKGTPLVFAFHGAYHGMTLGSLAATGDRRLRSISGAQSADVVFFPYPHGVGETFDTIGYMDAVISDPKSGVDTPAAVIVETVQAEGGVIVASADWLRRLRDLCDRHEILLIIDDVQVGCGRTGSFFSFEEAGIVPDMVILSKSLSGYGLPLAIVLLRRALDIWEPGDYKGTFRGFQLSFISAAAALEYWERPHFLDELKEKARFMECFLRESFAPVSSRISVRGRGMIWGLQINGEDAAAQVSRGVKRCYEEGLLVESAGRFDSVVKVLPPLTIERAALERGLDLLKRTLQSCL